MRPLAGAMQEPAVKPLTIEQPVRFSRFFRWRAWTSGVPVPRLAIAAGLLVMVALVIGLDLVRAQNRGPWFQFELHLPKQPSSQSGEPRSYILAHAGYRSTLLYGQPDGGVAAMIAVKDVQTGMVQLAVRARRYQGPVDSRVAESELRNLEGHIYHYVPGRTLEIPVEGGATLILSGQVLQERPPSLAGGFPVNPGATQLVLTNPALIKGNNLLTHFDAGAMTMTTAEPLSLYVPKEGLFVFSLQPLRGGVEGEAKWAQLRFTVGGSTYTLFSATTISGGEQPRLVWVCRYGEYVPRTDPAVPLLRVGNDSVSGVEGSPR